MAAKSRCTAALAGLFEVPPGPDDPPGTPPRERRATAGAILIIVVINSTVDAWVGSPRRVDRPPGGEVLQEAVNALCLAFFTIEMLLRMAGFGLWRAPDAYFKRPWCVFDFVVTMSTYAEYVLRAATGTAIGGVQSLRAFRLLRFLAVGGSAMFPNLTVLLSCMGLCIKRMIAIVIILASFLLTAAAIAASLFGDVRASISFCALGNTLELPPRHCGYPSTQDSPSTLGHKCSNMWSGHTAFGDEVRRALAAGDAGGRSASSCQPFPGMPSLDGLHGFDSFGRSLTLVTTLLNYMLQEQLVLETIDQFGHVALILFVSLTTFGSLVLIHYLTAIYVITYMESLGRFDSDPFGSLKFAAEYLPQDPADSQESATKDTRVEEAREHLMRLRAGADADDEASPRTVAKWRARPQALRACGAVRLLSSAYC